MRLARSRRIAYMVVLLAIVASCRHAPPTIVTPQGAVAFHLEDAIDAVNALQHAAIVGNRAGKVSDRSTALIVRYRRVVVADLDKAIDAGTGSEAALLNASNGLATLRDVLVANEKEQLAISIEAVRTVLDALRGEPK